MPSIEFQVPFEIVKGLKPYYVTPYRTITEKAILEFDVMVDDKQLVFDNVCRLLNIPDLPIKLKLAWIYKAREVSFGSDMEIRWKCEHCKNVSEQILEIDNLLSWPLLDEFPKYKDLEITASLEQIQTSKISDGYKFFKGLEQPKTFLEASEITTALRARIPTVKTTLQASCMFCKHPKPVEIMNVPTCLKQCSSRNLTGMYKTYSALARNGFSKSDVDSMLPFEREIHMKLIEQKAQELQETKEKYRQKRQELYRG